MIRIKFNKVIINVGIGLVLLTSVGVAQTKADQNNNTSSTTQTVEMQNSLSADQSNDKVQIEKNTQLYSRPDTNARVLQRLNSSTELQLINQQGDFDQVKINGRTGYVPTNDIKQSTNSNNSTNNRNQGNENSSSTNSNKATKKNKQPVKIGYTNQITNLYEKNGKDLIGLLGQHSRVRIIKDNGKSKLVNIQYESHYGYIYRKDLSSLTNYKKPNYLTQQTDFYAKSNQDSKKLKTLKKFTSVDVQSQSNGWSKVKIGNQTGYISTNNLGSMIK